MCTLEFPHKQQQIITLLFFHTSKTSQRENAPNEAVVYLHFTKDTKFYAKVNKDLTQTNQKIVKDTVNKLILEQKLPSTARNLFVTTPKTSTFYLKPKIHKPNNPGRPIIKYFFDQRIVKEPSTDTLLCLAELVLTLNCFTFSGEIFKQINNVAMGTKMGPNYANLFVGYVEEQIFNQFDGPKPELFGRYIDDCLGATSCTKEELERFIGFVNSFHPALKFTWESLKPQSLFSISTFLSKTTNWQPVSTTNPQIRTVTYCTRLPTHLTSKTQFRTPNFSDSVGSAAKIQTLTPNATKCPISFPNVAIRTASCLKHSIGSKTSIENRL